MTLFFRKTLLCTMLIALGQFASAADALEQQFLNPPDSTKPRCYWYWLDNLVSQEGITKDLEAMHRFGIGAAYIGIIGGGNSGGRGDPQLKTLSQPWWDNVRHAIREGGRIGVDIGFFNSPGWSQSGGPWVKPEQSMRYVTTSELRLRGPQHFSAPLPKPRAAVQELAVLAFPAPAHDAQEFKPSAKTATAVTFALTEATTVRSITIRPVKALGGNADFQVSDDGQTYRTLRTFSINRSNPNNNVGFIPLAPLSVTVPLTTGRFFRILFPKPCEPGEVVLSSASRLEAAYDKQLAKMFPSPVPPFNFYSWPTQAEPDAPDQIIARNSVVDLTEKCTSDGTLTWDVPPGEWVILRSGLAPTGTKNDPASPEATGLEVDKMNHTPLRAHFEAYVGKLYDSMPAAERRAFKYVVADSYEKGAQNWTDGFAELFQRRYGYSPLPFLPTLTGRIVGSADQSERFLWDVRRLVADRVASEYVGGLRDLCRERGLTMWLENYGHWGFPGEFLQYGGAGDQIGGEFWVDGLGPTEVRCATSAAHIYGKNTVWAEAFTGGPAFRNTPRELKARGDWSFAEGITQFVLHVTIHQPDERKPGVNAPWGTEFNRHNTWFAYGKSWTDYLRRCTVLLQAGRSVADVAYFIGEDAPKMSGECKPALPSGYDYDFINAEVIQNRLTVKNGRFILPDGTSYRLLVLPTSQTMRPAVLKKIAELVRAGGKVLGTAPERSPSLENHPACDAEVQSLATSLWGSGQILTGQDLGKILRDLGTEPAIHVPVGMAWKHRTDQDLDIFFVANQQAMTRTETISFRVDGRTPELWWPESGIIEPAPAFTLANGRVEVPITFHAQTSVFVVFRTPATASRALIKNSETAPVQPATAIPGPWQVRFGEQQATFEKLIPWSEHADPTIKYFSGAATYSTTIQIPSPNVFTTLDLGTVNAIAQVRVNGQDLGTVWKAPYQVALREALRPGSNLIEITVVNTWLNHLIGDLQPGATATTYRTKNSGIEAKTALQPSGLLGPVQLRTQP